MTDSRGNPEPGVTSAQYVRWLFEPADKLAVLVRSRERGLTAQRITSAAKAAEDSFQSWLRLKNENQSADVYIGMNPLKPEARARTKDDILAIRHLYVDLDREAARSLAAIEQSDLVPSPNALLETSPHKLQLIWRVEGFTPEHAEAMLRTMAREFGGDPAATDSTRVLRLPGFRNWKYDRAFTVTAKILSERRCSIHDFRLRSQPSDLDDGPRRMPGSTPRPGLSQSEHDWAYAKRSLAKGVPTEEVVRQIAAFRAYDKHNAEDYARRTVSKAEAQLRASRLPEESQTNLPPHRD